MLKKLMQTDENAGMLIVRLTLGIVMFPHGAQKLLGWFGGAGFAGTLKGMTGMGLPAAVVILVIAVEFLGSLSLIFGCLGRVSALGYIGLMLGAIFMVHLPNGFFMNWMGNQKGEGFEYHLLAIAIGIALMIKGGGRWSLDRVLSGKMK